VAALLALFLLQHSRRHARRDVVGRLVPLDRQDRGRWDHDMIAEGRAVLARTPVTGPYAIQARIAAEHTARPPAWRAIASWYDELERVQPTPAVQLNRVVAHGYAYGPSRGLEMLASLRSAGGALDSYQLAVEADLIARSGNPARAAALFRRAAAIAPSDVERDALLTRAEEL
jgi:RNA polymerase sigma-70 factor (ECF subfamily)